MVVFYIRIVVVKVVNIGEELGCICCVRVMSYVLVILPERVMSVSEMYQ